MNQKNAHVLVVDDQDSGRFVKVQILRRAGFTVYEASTGQGALDVAGVEPIDLVVLDVNLPDIGGLEVGRRIRAARPGPPALQILHVSSTAVEDSDRARGLNAGADAYLLEPLDAGVLVATVNALLRVRRAEASLADALVNEQHARAEAEQANRLKDEFIATLSHELRTPLNALMGWISQLRQATLSESGRIRALDSLERNTRIQAQLINDLLDISRISKGKLQLQMRVVDVAAVAKQAVESVSATATRKELALEIKTESVFVAGDDGRLQQIVGNLLNNAIQFTPEGGRVTLTVTRESGHAVVRVVDTGAGIDPATLPFVFEPFRQGRDGLSRAHGGLGLGLAVVQQLVELHDGSVSVTSEGSGRGSTFTVGLSELDGSTAEVTSDDKKLLLSGLEVLVVGTTVDARETLAAILESSGALVVQQDSSLTGADSVSEVDVMVNDQRDDVVLRVMTGNAKSTPEARIAKPIRAGALVRSVATLAQMRSTPNSTGTRGA